MSLIFNIETATRICSVGLARGGQIMSIRESNEKNIHASKVTVFIEEILEETGVERKDIKAVAVSMGPGSYTGLRIGVSVAKGLCYAMDIPLLAISTLQAMALGASEILGHNTKEPDLFCPMIDARRMEVYCALFNVRNEQVREIKAEIIDENSFSSFLDSNRIWFFGDGADKCREVLSGKKDALFPRGGILDSTPSARYLARLSHQAFLEDIFEDLAYFEPYYLKDFIAGIPRVKGL
jgi:tRNA threonylcarbamoyladenosine biosynthesis protein TsaB